MKKFDNSFLTDKIKFIAGVDEAGRGPLAGPVVSAAVVFDSDVFFEGINDSKKLTEQQREEIFPHIMQRASAVGISVISHGLIDKINILQASLKSMRIAVDRLTLIPDLVLVDGNKSFAYDMPVIPVIKGDSKSFAIAAASIVAKVTRDRIMTRLCPRFPEYKWSKNKGYATKEHILAIETHGPSPLHRKTFLRKILAENSEPELKFIR